MDAVQYGKAGWVRYVAPGLPLVYLRLTPNDRGRWLVRELVIDATESDPLTAGTLAHVPLSALETYVNGSKRARDTLASRMDLVSATGGPATGSNIAVLASHFASNFGTKPDPTSNWCAAAALTTYPDSPHKVRKQKPPPVRGLDFDTAYRLAQAPGPDGLSDEFLSRLGRAYVAASLRGEPPNQTIAADVHASPRSVERWVYEARRRGIMPPARAKGARG